jgi:hypothetical protein
MPMPADFQSHRNVLVVVKQPPTDPHRHILVYYSIQVQLHPPVDWPSSRCCFNDNSFADVVDARGVARVHVPINLIWIRESAAGRLGTLRLDLVNEEALSHESARPAGPQSGSPANLAGPPNRL